MPFPRGPFEWPSTSECGMNLAPAQSYAGVAVGRLTRAGCMGGRSAVDTFRSARAALLLARVSLYISGEITDLPYDSSSPCRRRPRAGLRSIRDRAGSSRADLHLRTAPLLRAD